MTVGAVLASKQGRPKLKLPGRIIHYQRTEVEPMAYVVAERDSGNAAIVQEIEYTDFPFDVLPEATIWVAPTEMGGKIVQVAYLASEH